MVIFRENTEDIYAGIEYKAGTTEARQVIEFLQEQMGGRRSAFPDQRHRHQAGLEGRLQAAGARRASSTPWTQKRKSVTLVHKGNIMKFTEAPSGTGATRWRGRSTAAVEIDGGPWCRLPRRHRDQGHDRGCVPAADPAPGPAEYDVIATLNLNGDYISDALAAQVGGIGIAPGANINYLTGHAIFEATHGTAPKYASQDKVNPGSVILSGEMMLRYLGWNEAADLIIWALGATIAQKRVTYDFERLMPGVTLVRRAKLLRPWWRIWPDPRHSSACP